MKPIILAIVLMNAVGMSLVIPLLPFLVGKYMPAEQVVVGMSALMSVFAACTFIAAPIFGALSDRYGRRNILMISLLGSVAGYVLFGIGGSLWMLFLGRIIDGLTAGNISTLFAIITDITAPEERTKWFGYMGAVMGIGLLAGPALGGLLGAVSLSMPFFITAGIIFLSCIAVYGVLPETLQPEKRTTHLTIGSFNIFSHLSALKEIKFLFILGMFFYAGLEVFQSNLTILLKDIFKWGPAYVGGLLTLAGGCDIFSRAVLLPFLLKRLNERITGQTGIFLLGTGLLFIVAAMLLSSLILIALAVICILFGEGLFDPTYNSLLSQSVDESNQGKIQGVNQSLRSCIRVLIPLGAATLYYYSPCILYIVATCSLITAFIMYGKNGTFQHATSGI
ncbi:MFS transporter [Chitinophaga sancti]|uniref:MFS transporter n=2 Tax=Chitinophaga sancti TaxID=1004 RepID=A0A1K1RT71_9BACT|nr:MFS transporter [Chitinophaga sancti]WQG91978.1 MFS transporter [Chitinophaga sancti]SFW75021.1 MFS transporter, DHA1 family, tetracycline resistance protein [Chitinophaga sancti]